MKTKNPNSWLQRNLQIVFFKLILLRKRQIKSMFYEFINNQYLTFEQIDQINWDKRKKLVSYAYENVPYYTKKFNDVGFHPNDLKTPDDFQKVPILTREDIRNNLENLVAKKIDKKELTLTGTGGSTGTPLMVYKHKKLYGLELALQSRMLSWWGIKPINNYAIANRIINKSNQAINLKPAERIKNILINSSQSLKSKLMSIIQRSIQLDASLMDANEMDNFIKKLNKVKPEYLVGYVGAIDEFATYYESKKINNQLNIKAVWTTAAPLLASTRHNIEKSFGCPVYDQYGSIEVFWLAAECSERNGLHFFYDARHIEFLDETEKSTRSNISGNVVITDLENYSFPIIRYKNGDKGSWKNTKCTCGVNLPLINSIQGRTSDRIFLKDGSSISGEFLTTVFDSIANEVKGFQIHQLTEEKLIVKIVLENPERFEDISRLIGEYLQKTTKGLINIEFINAKEIKHNKGKLQYIISDLSAKKVANNNVC